MRLTARCRRFAAWLAVVLAVGLVGTQTVGFRHGIFHADRIDARLAARTSDAAGLEAQQTPATGAEHSCAALDALALGAAAVAAVLLAVPPADAVASFRSVSHVEPTAPVALAYRSRAPPLPTPA